MKINIETANKNLSLIPLKTLLQNLNILLELGLDSLALHIFTDEELVLINKSYLEHDDYTDIITFDLRDEFSNDAEIFISYDRIIDNAQAFGVSADEELTRVCIHGMLHLSGKKDKTPEEKKEMRESENKYLKKLFHVKP